jgi:hypothetical protein
MLWIPLIVKMIHSVENCDEDASMILILRSPEWKRQQAAVQKLQASSETEGTTW